MRWAACRCVFPLEHGRSEAGYDILNRDMLLNGGDRLSEKPVVHCSVSNCKFWGNFRCQASEIMIDIDAHANMKADPEFAAESFRGDHKDTASRPSATCCQTFEPK